MKGWKILDFPCMLSLISVSLKCLSGWPTEFFLKIPEHFHLFQEHMDGQDEVIFSHKWEIQTGGNRKYFNLKNSDFKNNSRTSLKKWLFSFFFQVHFQYQKIPEQFKEFKEFRTVGHPACAPASASSG